MAIESDPKEANHSLPRDASAEDLLVGRGSETRPVLSIVMPTLNEEAGVAECIDAAKRAIEQLGVPAEIIVSDSSTDRTPEIARSMGAIVVEPNEGGYGYAYRYAFERARGDYVVMGDADTTYDFEELPKLYELVAEGGADIAMGSRLEGEIKDGAMPALHQYVGNPLLTRFLNAFYDAGVSDAHSGFRVIRRDAFDHMSLESDGMEFASEMIMEAAAKGLTIEEEPITYHEREGEATLESFRDGWRHVKFMLVNAPTYLFVGPGTVMTLAGLFLMAVSFAGLRIGDINIAGQMYGGFKFGLYSMISGSLLTITGYQVVSFGMFANLEGDPIQSPGDTFVARTVDKFRLEHGATVGTVLMLLGSVFAGYLFFQGLEAGFSNDSLLMANILAFTAIMIGIQIVFGSFFLSALAGEER